uniref:Uncharacterized protein n=1 Tax=Anopheles farauti TaxID=69004 RepID=A0A182Q2T8_9DIPT
MIVKASGSGAAVPYPRQECRDLFVVRRSGQLVAVQEGSKLVRCLSVGSSCSSASVTTANASGSSPAVESSRSTTTSVAGGTRFRQPSAISASTRVASSSRRRLVAVSSAAAFMSTSVQYAGQTAPYSRISSHNARWSRWPAARTQQKPLDVDGRFEQSHLVQRTDEPPHRGRTDRLEIGLLEQFAQQHLRDAFVPDDDRNDRVDQSVLLRARLLEGAHEPGEKCCRRLKQQLLHVRWPLGRCVTQPVDELHDPGGLVRLLVPTEPGSVRVDRERHQMVEIFRRQHVHHAQNQLPQTRPLVGQFVVVLVLHLLAVGRCVWRFGGSARLVLDHQPDVRPVQQAPVLLERLETLGVVEDALGAADKLRERELRQVAHDAVPEVAVRLELLAQPVRRLADHLLQRDRFLALGEQIDLRPVAEALERHVHDAHLERVQQAVVDLEQRAVGRLRVLGRCRLVHVPVVHQLVHGHGRVDRDGRLAEVQLQAGHRHAEHVLQHETEVAVLAQLRPALELGNVRRVEVAQHVRDVIEQAPVRPLLVHVPVPVDLAPVAIGAADREVDRAHHRLDALEHLVRFRVLERDDRLVEELHREPKRRVPQHLVEEAIEIETPDAVQQQALGQLRAAVQQMVHPRILLQIVPERDVRVEQQVHRDAAQLRQPLFVDLIVRRQVPSDAQIMQQPGHDFDNLEHGRDRPGHVRHRAVAAARRTVVQVLADVGGPAAQQQPGGGRLADVLVLGAAEHRVAVRLALVLQEQLVRPVHQMLDVDDRADRREYVVLGDERQHHQRLDHQLPVLGLRDRVQRRLDLERKLQLVRGHLLREALRQDAALDRQPGAPLQHRPDARVKVARHPVQRTVEPAAA